MKLNPDLTDYPTSPVTRLMRWTIITTAFTALLLAASTTKAASEFRLYVKPSICVSYDSSADCTMTMLVSWESSAIASVCLQQDKMNQTLQCWENSTQGSVHLDYAETTDVLYQLLDTNSKTVVAESEVIVINRDLRQSKMRRRHVWSIL